MTSLIRILVGIPALGFVLLAFTPATPSVITPLLFVVGGVCVLIVAGFFKWAESRKLARYDRQYVEYPPTAVDAVDYAEEGYTGEAA